jgi:hypothetical protein
MDMSYLPPEWPAVTPVTLPRSFPGHNGFWAPSTLRLQPVPNSSADDDLGTSHQASEPSVVGDVGTIEASGGIYAQP